MPAHGWHGGLLRAPGRPLEALKALDRALALDSVLAWTWAWKGETLLRLGRHTDALEPLRRATALDPFNADARVWRSEALAAVGRHGEAVSAARAALSAPPDHWRPPARPAAPTGRRSPVARVPRPCLRPDEAATESARGACSSSIPRRDSGRRASPYASQRS